MLGRYLAGRLPKALSRAITSPGVGGGGAAFDPASGAVALYYFNSYATSPVKHIPNAVSSRPISHSWLHTPRRMFAAYDTWYAPGVTASDAGVADPFGGTEASTISCTGAWLIGVYSSATLPAGTWTFAVWAKRNTGSNQTFAFSADGGATRSSAKTATATWQRFTHTFTTGGGNLAYALCLCSVDGVTGAELAVIDFELFPGSSDLGLGADNAGGHFYTGLTDGYSPTISGNTFGGFGVSHLPAKVSRDAFTVVCLAKMASYPGLNSIISDAAIFSTANVQTINGTFGYPNVTDANTSFMTGITGLTTFQMLQNIPPVDSLYRQHAYTFDNGLVEHWINDVRIHSWPTTLTAFDFYTLFVNATNQTYIAANVLGGFLGLYNRAFSADEMLACFDANKTQAIADGLTVGTDTTDRYLFIEGDSITANSSACYPFVFLNGNDSPVCWGSNWAVPGSTVANVSARAATLDASLPTNKKGRKFILSLLIGANDLGSYATGAAGYITDLRAYCSARAAAGWTVTLGTILPKEGEATHNSRRATVNADIRANPTAYGLAGTGAIFDFAADASMGPDSSRASNPTLWDDGVHPSAAGQLVLEPIYRACINAL